MLDFFRAFFRPAPPSGSTAKERLRLVLLSDHLSLAPDVIEALKRDLLDVISRYVEIDPANADVTFEQRDHEVAMLASIPITGVRDRERPRAPQPPQLIAPLAEEAVASTAASESPGPSATEAAPETRDAPLWEADTSEVPPLSLAPAMQADEVSPPGRSASGSPPRRRRRKKKAAGAASAPANKLATGSG